MPLSTAQLANSIEQFDIGSAHLNAITVERKGIMLNALRGARWLLSAVTLHRWSRVGPPCAVGVLVASAMTWDAPWWMRVLTVAMACGLAYVSARSLQIDEHTLDRERAERDYWRNRAWEIHDKNVRLHKELARLADDVASYDAQALDAEHKLVSTWERAAVAYRHALSWRYLAESSAKREQHWRYVAEQNASEGAKLATVLLAKIAQLGGDSEIDKARDALRAFEHGKN